MSMKSKLEQGMIPAATVCPFKEECDPDGKFCRHQGVNHTCAYSCAFARGYDILARKNTP